MADPWSIAGATIGYASLAAQLLVCVNMLKELYRTVEKAPQEVEELCAEMIFLAGMLRQCDGEIQKAGLPGLNSSVFSQAKVQDYRSNVPMKIHAGIQGHNMNAIRFSFKRQAIIGILIDLECGKSALLLA